MRYGSITRAIIFVCLIALATGVLTLTVVAQDHLLACIALLACIGLVSALCRGAPETGNDRHKS